MGHGLVRRKLAERTEERISGGWAWPGNEDGWQVVRVLMQNWNQSICDRWGDHQLLGLEWEAEPALC